MRRLNVTSRKSSLSGNSLYTSSLLPFTLARAQNTAARQVRCLSRPCSYRMNLSIMLAPYLVHCPFATWNVRFVESDSATSAFACAVHSNFIMSKTQPWMDNPWILQSAFWTEYFAVLSSASCCIRSVFCVTGMDVAGWVESWLSITALDVASYFANQYNWKKTSKIALQSFIIQQKCSLAPWNRFDIGLMLLFPPQTIIRPIDPRREHWIHLV